VSFSDQPTYGSWKHIGCFLLGVVLLLGNGLFLLSWYFTYYDLSTQTYRPLALLDLIVPVVIVASAVLLWLYYRFLLRDDN
jgi:uncharacterized BrkB/YihY/UPF0761 family membrane protein